MDIPNGKSTLEPNLNLPCNSRAAKRYELRYWCEKYGVSPERLRTAVRRAGVMAVDVERELGKR